MTDLGKYAPRMPRKAQLGLGAAALLILGGAAGAGAVEATRPSVEMAPVQPVAIASLPQKSGLVTVKGRVAEVYGDRFTISDGSGKALVDLGGDAGREGGGLVTAGAPLTVQGRYDDGQLRASFLIDGNGQIDQVGHAGRRPHDGPRGRHGRGPDGRGPDGLAFDGPPPPPPGGPGAMPPPPGAGCPPVPAAGTAPPPPPQGPSRPMPAPAGAPRVN